MHKISAEDRRSDGGISADKYIIHERGVDVSRARWFGVGCLGAKGFFLDVTGIPKVK